MNDWRDTVETTDYVKVESFKLKNGSATVHFRTEGLVWFSQQDNKEYVIFKVQKDGDIVRPFFVNAENKPFLRKLKSFGKLTDREIVLTRTGERRATRWEATLPSEQIKVEKEVV